MTIITLTGIKCKGNVELIILIKIFFTLLFKNRADDGFARDVQRFERNSLKTWIFADFLNNKPFLLVYTQYSRDPKGRSSKSRTLWGNIMCVVSFMMIEIVYLAVEYRYRIELCLLVEVPCSYSIWEKSIHNM